MLWWISLVSGFKPCAHEVPIEDLVLAKTCKGRVVRNPVKSLDDVDFTKDYARPDSMAQVRSPNNAFNTVLGSRRA